jgi:hypothetical protein
MLNCTLENGIIRIETAALEAAVRTTKYVTGIMGCSFLDKATGTRDPSFGLLLMDFLLAPGWRDDGYLRHPLIHGNLPKHLVESPLITTEVCNLPYAVIRGPEHVAVKLWFTFTDAGKGYRTGSRWEQTLLFLPDTRYILACETVRTVNAVDYLFYRMDVPGHLKHRRGDTFRQIYLSYEGFIPAAGFRQPFPPDARHLYTRDPERIPDRFIRAYQLAAPDGTDGPWLAGMTLEPSIPCEAWCHQRQLLIPGRAETAVAPDERQDYVCFIQENHGHPVSENETFGAAYVLGYFDSVGEMNSVYDRFKGTRFIRADSQSYALEKEIPQG